MGPKEFSEQRFEALIAEVQKLEQSEFPYRHSQEALRLLEDGLRASLAAIRSIDVACQPAIRNQMCILELGKASESLLLMGFLLRSTNVRNPFEAFRPLLRLARQVLAQLGVPRDDVRLLLSSEWQASPFVFQSKQFLENFVLIGMPAAESSNPLLLPLAGHELGHTVWEKGDLGTDFRARAADQSVDAVLNEWARFGQLFPDYAGKAFDRDSALKDLFVMEVVNQGRILASCQIEETFCDFFGLAVFGEGYLYAFAYLVAPGTGDYYDPDYPNLSDRVENLMFAASQLSIEIPLGYQDWFEDQLVKLPSKEQAFACRIAHSCVQHCRADVLDKARSILRDCGLVVPTRAESDRIRKRFDYLIPADNAASLADLVNAGWHASQDAKFLERTDWTVEKRKHVLYDLVLKSLGLLDIADIRTEVGANDPEG